jgi:Mg-chelatase subunit ChlD
MFPDEVRSTDLEDTILRAQVRAALKLLEELDARRVRVGVITFSGAVDPANGERLSDTQQDAQLEIPLTGDFAAARAALAGVLARGPHGATNFGAGIALAVAELSGLSGARSQPRADARKVVLFLTDGLPTFPVGKGTVVDAGDEEFALRAADLARTAGIAVNTYALGPEALKYNRVTTEVARRTHGVYTPVQSPDDVIALLSGTTFADIEDVVFTNLTTGDFSTDVRLAPDGSFAGYLPVREGRNRVRIVALASDGTRGELELELEFALSQVGSRDKLAELERIRRQNRELEIKKRSLEIEAFRAQQRRDLEIEVKGDGEREPAPPP